MIALCVEKLRVWN